MAPFGRRLHRHHTRGGSAKMHPLAVVGICLGVAVVITVIVGNLLNIFLDDDTYRKLTDGEEAETAVDPVVQSSVRDVNAYPFFLGGNTDEIVGHTAVSVALNRADGTLCYTSDVAKHFGLPTLEEVVLFDAVTELNGFVPYISGAFYSHALENDNPDLQYAVTAQESALLREFLHVGGSEVLIFGLTPTVDNIDNVVAYLKTVKLAAGKSPVGIAIPHAIASDRANWSLLAKLGETCDFLALDMTAEEIDASDVNDLGISPAAEKLIADSDYLLTAYDMRLVFAESQTALISTAVAKMQPDFQIVK